MRGRSAESKVEMRENRRVIRRLLPSARIAQNTAAMGGGADVAAGPDMVQPAALVGGVPVTRAVRPPAVKLTLGNVGPGHVMPSARLHRVAQMLDLDRRVADNLQQLLV